MTKAEIIEKMNGLTFGADKYWVVAGAAMVLHGIKPETADIDLGCTKELADRLEKEGNLHKVTEDGNRWFKIGDGIDVFENWLYDRVEMINDVPVISLNGLIEMKKRLGREKDLRDIALIEGFLPKMVLIKPTEEYLLQIKNFRAEFEGQFDWIHGAQKLKNYEDPAKWLEFLTLCENEQTLPEGFHLYSQFIFVRLSDRKIVGMIGFWHKPFGDLETWGGHIGYCVCPSERQKGYATQMLKKVLPYCKEMGLDRVLLTAGDENVGSVKTILNSGGVFEKYYISPRHNRPIGRYWIDISV